MRIHLRAIFLLLFLIGINAPGSLAQGLIDAAEKREFDAAVRAFEDGLQNYARAEKEFAAFVQKWPQSSLLAQANLYLAQSRHHRGNHLGAVELLTQKLPAAGKWADHYQFWIAESWFDAENYEKAANAFADLLINYGNSSLRFRASYNEALARRRLNQFSDVISLLENPAGPFRQNADLYPENPLNSSGNLLLAEARLEINDHIGAQNAMNNLKGWELDQQQKWQRQYLLCRLALAAGEPNAALTATTNLVLLAEASGLAEARAQTFHLQSGIFESLQRLDDAAIVLTNNLVPGTPVRLKREALLKVIDLHIDRNQITNAIATLDRFSQDNTNDPALPLAFRTVGELRLRQYHRLPPTNRPSVTASNLLSLANRDFTRALDFPRNRRGQSAYYRGWCNWHLGNWAGAAADFATAADNLAISENHAIAKFKLAECQLRQNDNTNAVDTLGDLVNLYRNSGRLRDQLLDHALYKLLRAAVAIGDLERAEDAAQHIINWYPESFFGDRSLLFYGQALNQKGRPGDARDAFQRLISRFPKSDLVPQVQIAMARTYEQERNWSAAAFQLQNWARQFPSDPLLPDVEYERAWLTYQSGAPDQAFQLYTNFIHRFPAHTNAPLAEKWVADYFFNQGNYVKAQERYQLLYENPRWGDSRLKYESQLAAGRAALAGGLINEATNTFIRLLKPPSNVPEDMKSEIWFALGDSFSQLDDHGQAINAFRQITRATVNRLTAYAHGRIGDCHLQLSSDDPARLELAAEAYQTAMNAPQGEAHARSLAEFGLGQVLEKQGNPEKAIDHYSNILYWKNLRAGEQVSYNAMLQAGYAIARIQETKGAFPEAIKIYERLAAELPSVRASVAPRIARLQARLRPVQTPTLTPSTTPINLRSNGN